MSKAKGRGIKNLATRAKVLAMSKGGFSAKQIAEEVGVSLGRAYELIKLVKRADYLEQKANALEVARKFLHGRPEGSWTSKEINREFAFILDEDRRHQTIKNVLRQLGYVNRWIHTSTIGLSPSPVQDTTDEKAIMERMLAEVARRADDNARQIAQAKREQAKAIADQTHEIKKLRESRKRKPKAVETQPLAPTEALLVPVEKPMAITASDYAAAAIAAGRVPVPSVPVEDKLSDDLDEIGF